ncbi:hypothetical protein PMYN1_Chma603 (chromatophore) [Paulinella micropora]|uniref:Uncharacterized protein n=1 Tax=Paulinella micropora TaxID=1928728 RepID=A0A5K7W4U7_9EUKA|nr:hypothetical protein PMYN1_Chma603 [Paulinella micropora]
MLYVKNRRDSSRLLSSALIVSIISLMCIDHLLGRILFVIGGSLGLYFWIGYKKVNQ